MDWIGSFSGVIALWIAVSTGLWWLHRRVTIGRQKRQIDQAVRAAAHVRTAQPVFDAIRRSADGADAPADEAGAPADEAGAPTTGHGRQLTTDCYALLKRIQEHGAFFDKTNTLRVQLQSSLGIEDHAALAEILHLRRDLWAASEIVLVEDPSNFGSTFAEPGSYERFRDEALGLLFKSAKPSADEDSIDLRLSLAVKDADTFVAELHKAIDEARERNRLPTIAEITAYPLAIMRAVPRQLRLAYYFLRALFVYAGDTARTIRDSETMARGRRHLQHARETLPQRLSAGFERASVAARESATNLHRHYDFLAAAHDFQAKYEQLLRRAPEITERGRQFITRLDLAEKSERLRLTSANAMVWLARRLIDGMALMIAGLQRLRATAPWSLTAMILAPGPVRGRKIPAFRSFRMALAASGLSEERKQVTPMSQSVVPPAPSKAKAKSAQAATSRDKEPVRPRASAAAKPAAKTPAEHAQKEPVSPKPAPKPDRLTEILTTQMTRPMKTPAAKASPAPAANVASKADQPSRLDTALELTAAAPSEKKPSFFGRVFARDKTAASHALDEQRASVEALDEALAALEAAEPIADIPTLSEKLAKIAESEPTPELEGTEPVEVAAQESVAEAADEPGPLTLSVMDLQAKIKEEPLQIRAFPWLRG